MIDPGSNLFYAGRFNTNQARLVEPKMNQQIFHGFEGALTQQGFLWGTIEGLRFSVGQGEDLSFLAEDFSITDEFLGFVDHGLHNLRVMPVTFCCGAYHGRNTRSHFDFHGVGHLSRATTG